jgi:hypothetical protein
MIVDEKVCFTDINDFSNLDKNHNFEDILE